MLLMCFLLIKNTANEDHSYLMLRHFLYRLHAPINRSSNDEVCSKIGIWHNVTVKLGRPVTEVALTAKLCPFFGVHVHDLHSWMLSRLTTTTINIVLICNGPMQPHSAMSPYQNFDLASTFLHLVPLKPWILEPTLHANTRHCPYANLP